jgi:phospholipid/cholesterol/gamma-HCH transport system ATP-binding protein
LNAEPLIRIQELTIRLSGRDILKKINLDVRRGEILAVMGLSGVGKSTLLKCLIGLLKPTSGEIFLEGKEITGLKSQDLNDIRKKIGMVFQSPALFDSLTIGENVAFGLREHTRLPEDEIRRIVVENLAMVDLKGLEEMFPSQLSGGMQKRASLARTISTQPEIILYDEPTSGLDPIMSNVINDLILDMRNKLGATSIVVTHDMGSAFRIADRIAMLIGGKIVELNTAEGIKNSTNPLVVQFRDGNVEGPIKV